MTPFRIIWLVARFEFTTTVKRTGFLVALLGLPVAHLGLAALLGFAMQSAIRERDSPKPIALVDSEQVLGDIGDAAGVVLDEASALDGLRRGRFESVFVLDPGYLSNGRVRAYALPAPGLLKIRRRLAQREDAGALIRRGLTAGGSRDKRSRIVEPIVQLDTYRVEGSKVTAESSFPVLGVLGGPFGVCFVLALSIFLVSGTLQQAMAAEVQNRMLEVLQTLMSPVQLLAGKTMGLAAAGLIQVFVYLVMTLGLGPAFALEEVSPSALLWSGAIFMTGYLLFSILLAAVGVVAPDPQESTQVASICLLAAALPFFFVMHISASPGSLVARALTWFPPTAPVSLLLRLGVDGVGVAERLAAIANILVFSAVMLWLAAALFALRTRSAGRLRIREVLVTLAS